MSTRRFDLLGKTVLIGSGALGTTLRQRWGAFLSCVEALNLSSPDLVRSVHRAYREAGSDILVTNTFAANPLLLDEVGLADQATAINAAGVQLAREVAGSETMVWASVGPLSLGLRSADYSSERLRDIYRIQVAGLRDADAILLETFQDEREAAAAAAAATETGLPLVVQAGFTGGGHAGVRRLAFLVRIAEEAGARAVGVNCRHPREIEEALRHVLSLTHLPVTVAPNAGTPSLERGRVRYEFAPEAFADMAETLWQMGAAVVGGCCGTTPDHIQAVARRIRGRPVPPRMPPAPIPPTPHAEASVARPAHPVRDLLCSRRFLISVEVRAERTSPLEAIVCKAQEMAQAGADLLDVPDKPGASVARDAAVVAARIQQATGLPALPHKAVVHANLLEAHSALLGAWDLGLRAMLVVTGDSPAMGPLRAWASRVSDLKTSVELIRLATTLRSGIALSGEAIADPPDFCVGCALGKPTPGQMEWLQKKLDAGAEFVLTQPVFTVEEWRRLQETVATVSVRVFPGVLPLLSRRTAEGLASGRVPGVCVPESVVAALARYESPMDQRQKGLELAEHLVRTLAREGRSLYLIPPWGRWGHEAATHLVCLARAEAKAPS